MMHSNTQNRKNASGSRLDIGWEHGKEFDNDPKKITCKYCNEIIPGNVYRFKHHLACTKKNVKACTSVPIEVRKQMSSLLSQQMKSSNRKMMNDEEEMLENVSHKRRKTVIETFSNRTIGTTQSILNQNSEKKLRDEACQQIVRFFRTSDITFSCVKNPEFAKMFELVGKCASEFVPPSYHELENSSLGKETKNITDMLEEYKYEWKKTGCSIICDEWTDMKGIFYYNFLLNNPVGTIFLKSIDTYDFSETTEKVFEVLDEIVEKVGVENVVQVITNNTANYKAAGKMLIEKRKKIFWSPCVVQMLDGILEDFEKNLLHHRITIAKGKKISTFIYSRTTVISMLRDFTNGKDLTGPTTTPSATAYLTLLYLIDMKNTIIELSLLEKWESQGMSKTKEGEEIRQIIQDCKFWDDTVDCLNFALPIIEVLLKIDSDEKPTMGFIYEEMKRAKESLQSLNNTKGYETICKIIKERWNPLLHPQYTASYYLNPQLRYGSTFEFPYESIEKTHACLAEMVIDYDLKIRRTSENLQKVKNQLIEFSNPDGLFESPAVTMARHTKDPAKWWDSYGSDCPELQRMAIRLLSLTCSSCGSGQIRNAYEQVYPHKRSHMYQRKMNDLFLVIQNFKSKTQQARTNIVEGNNPEVLSSDDELITEKEVGEVSGAKKDMLVNVGVDEDVSEGVPLPRNHSGNEVDTCLYNPQPQGSPSAGSHLYDDGMLVKMTEASELMAKMRAFLGL